MRRHALCFGLFVILLAGCGRAPASPDADPPPLGTGPLSTSEPGDAAVAPASPALRSFGVVRASPRETTAPPKVAKISDVPYIQTGPRGSIGGRITDSNGSPVSGVCVMTRDADDLSTLAGAAGQYVTDLTGAYRLDGTPSRVLVLVDTTCGPGAGDHTSAFYSADDVQPLVVDVTDIGASGVDIVLARKGRLAGTVTGLLGAPLPGVCVEVTAAGEIIATELTDLLGHFDVKVDQGAFDVEFDPCAITLDLGEYLGEFYDDSASAAAAKPVSVLSGSVANISAQLQRPPLLP